MDNCQTSPDRQCDGSGSSFKPVPRRRRLDGWTAERQETFLKTLAETGSVTAAARSVGMDRRSAYVLRRGRDAEAFAMAWEAALDCAVQNLREDTMSCSRQRFGRAQEVERPAVDPLDQDAVLALLMAGRRMNEHGVVFQSRADGPRPACNEVLTRLAEADANGAAALNGPVTCARACAYAHTRVEVSLMSPSTGLAGNRVARQDKGVAGHVRAEAAASVKGHLHAR